VEKRLLDFDAGYLASKFAYCQVWDDGTVVEIRKLVDQFDGLTLHVYANEHAPPHFHVKCAGREASYTLEDCTLLHGDLGPKRNKIVLYWFHLSRDRLIDAWNELRPGDCAVGEYHPSRVS